MNSVPARDDLRKQHHDRGLPWGFTYEGPDPIVIRRMQAAGTGSLALGVHLANEHRINPDKALHGTEVEHMHAHLTARFRDGQEHYHEDASRK